MTSAIKTAATSQQVREPTGELTADELALVTGGGTSSADPLPRETISFPYGGLVVTYTPQKP
jgi:hypothetical protein